MSLYLHAGLNRVFPSTEPASRLFGLDRGQPIDRYYIERFLAKNRGDIHGTVVEIGDAYYTNLFGVDIKKSEVLHFTKDNPEATLIGDLTQSETLPREIADCLICTQTFNFIYDVKAGVTGARQMLSPGGVLLTTVAGISQISRYDMDRWGDYWRFTTLSAAKIFGEVFGEKNVAVESYGNSLSARAFLNGLSVRELTRRQLDCKDQDYQMLITIRAIKA
jgi:Methyltransferase domain